MALPNEFNTLPNNNRKSIYFFIENRPFLVLTVLGVIFLLIFAYNQIYARTPRLVTALGVGIKKVAAERANVTFALVVDAADQNSAVTNGETQFTDVLTAVNQFSPSEVNKTSYQIVPQTNRITGITQGYQYVSGAQVMVESAQVENLVRLLNNKNATVAQVRYLPMDEKQIDKEVRELAVKDAKEKATQMAQASGARVGKVITVTEQGSTGETGTSVTGTNIANNTPFSDIEIQAVVQVTFELN